MKNTLYIAVLRDRKTTPELEFFLHHHKATASRKLNTWFRQCWDAHSYSPYTYLGTLTDFEKEVHDMLGQNGHDLMANAFLHNIFPIIKQTLKEGKELSGSYGEIPRLKDFVFSNADSADAANENNINH